MFKVQTHQELKSPRFLPYLQVTQLACHAAMGAGRRYKTWHSKLRELHVAVVPLPPRCHKGKVEMGPDSCCTCSEPVLQLGDPELMQPPVLQEGTARNPTQPSPQREILSLLSKSACCTNILEQLAILGHKLSQDM